MALRVGRTGMPALVIVGIALVLLSGVLGNSIPVSHSGATGIPQAGPSPVLGLDGALAMSFATQSLEGGAGPALGHPASCSTSGSFRCFVQSPTASSGTGHPVWSNLTPLLGANPSGRLSTMTWDASDGYVLLYGGAAASIYGDTWTYANGTWTNITGLLSGTPPRLAAGDLAFDPTSQKVIYFGGENKSSVFQSQTWSYHAKTWTNLTGIVGTAPPARALGSMVTDTTDNMILLYGGECLTCALNYLSDTWSFKNGAWTNLTAAAPVQGVVAVAGLGDDPADHGVLMVGTMIWHATSPYVYKSGTFLYSGGTWHNLTATLAVEPPLSFLPILAYEPATGGIVAAITAIVSTNGAASFFPVTWEYVGGAWKNITVASGYPPHVGLVAGGAILPDHSLVVFGGEIDDSSQNFSAATWTLAIPPTVTIDPLATEGLDAGTAATLTGTVSNGVAPITTKWTFSDGGANATGLSTSHTFASAGTEVVTLWATDFVGQTGSISVPITVHAALAVSLNASPSRPVAGASVALLSAVSGGTGPFTYSFSFGDGGTASNASSAGHTYSNAGTYAVALTVTDALGQSSVAHLSLTVGAAPAPGTSAALGSGTGIALLAAVILLAGLVVVLLVLLIRRSKGPKPPTPYSPEAPPSGGGSSPPQPPGGPPAG